MLFRSIFAANHHESLALVVDAEQPQLALIITSMEAKPTLPKPDFKDLFHRALRQPRYNAVYQYAIDLLQEATEIGELLISLPPHLISREQVHQLRILFSPVSTCYYHSIKARLIGYVVTGIKVLGQLPLAGLIWMAKGVKIAWQFVSS